MKSKESKDTKLSKTQGKKKKNFMTKTLHTQVKIRHLKLTYLVIDLFYCKYNLNDNFLVNGFPIPKLKRKRG